MPDSFITEKPRTIDDKFGTRDKSKKVDEIVQCIECGSTHLARDYEHGDLVCDECGLVLDETYILQAPEWLAHDKDQFDKKVHTGRPETFTIHDKGLSTEIDWKNKDGYGKDIPVKNRAQIYRMRRWQRRMRIANATERNLIYALGELNNMGTNMGLPNSVKETAAMVYRRAVKKNLIRGRSIDSVVGASEYAATRICKVSRNLDEIVKYSKLSAKTARKKIGKAYRIMVRELHLNIRPTPPEEYVKRFCSLLKFPDMKVELETYKILKLAAESNLIDSRDPSGVAVSAIYIASLKCSRENPEQRRTQQQVADIAGVTEVTIRNRYKEMTKKLGIDINSQLKYQKN